MSSLAIPLLERLCTRETAERLGPGYTGFIPSYTYITDTACSHFNFQIFKFYVCILCVHTHLSAVPTEVRRGYGVPRNWSYWQL